VIEDSVVVRIERIRDDAEQLRKYLRSRYSSATASVRAEEIREQAAALAERWLVEVASREDIADALGGSELADRNIQFQRLLTCAEKPTARKKYDQVLASILNDFRGRILVPLKARRTTKQVVQAAQVANSQEGLARSHSAPPRMVFIGQSFSDRDNAVNAIIARALRAMGLTVVTGEKPRADLVSKKVKDRIDQCDVFLGIFARRDKLEGKQEWATSPWVVDEKAYALARQKKLVLVKESGVSSIGGLQGDYEYLEFERTAMEEVVISLIEVFKSFS